MGCAHSKRKYKPTLLSLEVLSKLDPFIDNDFPPNYDSLIAPGDLIGPEYLANFRKYKWKRATEISQNVVLFGTGKIATGDLGLGFLKFSMSLLSDKQLKSIFYTQTANK